MISRTGVTKSNWRKWKWWKCLQIYSGSDEMYGNRKIVINCQLIDKLDWHLFFKWLCSDNQLHYCVLSYSSLTITIWHLSFKVSNFWYLCPKCWSEITSKVCCVNKLTALVCWGYTSLLIGYHLWHTHYVSLKLENCSNTVHI